MVQAVEKLEKQVSELQAVQQQVLEKVNRTSKNSSSPPSQDPPGFKKKPRKKKSNKKRGGFIKITQICPALFRSTHE